MMSSYSVLQCQQLSPDFKSAIERLSVVQAVPKALLEPNEVRIEVRAAALNYFDLLQLCGRYQVKPTLPFVPCCEGAGVVLEAGSAARARLPVGTRVMFCDWQPGAAAQQLVVGAEACHLLPASHSFEQGAGFLVGYATGYHALAHRGGLRAGETLLVTGAAGGMGLAAVQLGLAMGARVLAAASSDEKLRQVQRITGLPDSALINTSNLRTFKDRVSAALDGGLVDVAYECVGGDLFDHVVRVMNANGRLLVVGFTAGRIPALPVNLALVKGFSLVGVRSGVQLLLEPEKSKECYAELLKLAQAGKLKPHVGVCVPLSRFQEAFLSISSRTIVGKAVIVFPQGSAKL